MHIIHTTRLLEGELHSYKNLVRQAQKPAVCIVREFGSEVNTLYPVKTIFKVKKGTRRGAEDGKRANSARGEGRARRNTDVSAPRAPAPRPYQLT